MGAQELIISIVGQEAYDEMAKLLGLQEQAEANLLRYNELVSKIGTGGSTFKDLAEAQTIVNTAHKEGATALQQYTTASKLADEIIAQKNGHSREYVTVLRGLSVALREQNKAELETAKIATEASKQRLNNAKIETEALKQKVLQIRLTQDAEAKAFESTKAIRAQEAQIQKKRQADEAELTRLVQVEAKERAAADERELAMLIEKEAAGKRYIAMYTELLAAEEAAAGRGATTIGSRDALNAPVAQSVQADRYAVAGVTDEERAALQAKAAALDGVTVATNRNAAAERQLISYTAEEIALLRAQGVVLREGTYILKESAAATEANAVVQKLFAESYTTTTRKVESSAGGIAAATSGFRGLFGVLRQVAYIIPGIGVAGLLNLAIEPLIELGKRLFETSEHLRDVSAAEREAAEIGKRVGEAYGQEAAKLDLLKQKIENVNVPMKERLSGIRTIQEQFPLYFGNLTKEQILIGQVGDAYKKASEAILASARLRVVGQDLAKTDDNLVRLEERINRTSSIDREIAKVYKDANGYFQFSQERLRGIGQSAINPAYITGEKDKNGKDVWTTLLDDLQAYNVALYEHSVLLEKVGSLTPAASEDDKLKKEPKVKIDKSAEREAKRLAKEQAKAEALQDAIDRKKALDNSAQSIRETVTAEEEEINAIYKLKGKERLAAIDTNLREIADKVSENYRKQKDDLQALYDSGGITYKQYRRDFAAIQGQEDAATLAQQKEYTKRALSELMQEAGIPADVIQAVRDKLDKIYDKPAKDFTQYAEKIKSEAHALAQEVITLTQTLVDASFQRQQDQAQKQLDDLKSYHDAKLESISNELISTTEKDRKIAAYKAVAAREEEEQQKKINDIKRKQAIADRIFAIAKIAENTAMAVTAVASTGGGTYYADYGISAALLEGLVIALGAAQAAIILATPLPAYKDGVTDSGERSLAIVGDGNRPEVITTQDGQMFVTPSVPTVVDMPAHSRVHKSIDDFIAEAQYASFTNFKVLSARQQQSDSLSTAEMERLLKQVAKGVNRLADKNPVVIRQAGEVNYPYRFNKQ